MGQYARRRPSLSEPSGWAGWAAAGPPLAGVYLALVRKRLLAVSRRSPPCAAAAPPSIQVPTNHSAAFQQPVECRLESPRQLARVLYSSLPPPFRSAITSWVSVAQTRVAVEIGPTACGSHLCSFMQARPSARRAPQDRLNWQPGDSRHVTFINSPPWHPLPAERHAVEQAVTGSVHHRVNVAAHHTDPPPHLGRTRRTCLRLTAPCCSTSRAR